MFKHRHVSHTILLVSVVGTLYTLCEVSTGVELHASNRFITVNTRCFTTQFYRLYHRVSNQWMDELWKGLARVQSCYIYETTEQMSIKFGTYTKSCWEILILVYVGSK
jgi:hypothetical protein